MRLTSAGNLPISVFLALGAATAGYSCWKAKPEERKDVLVRSSTIVASSIVGVVASQKYSDKIIKQKPIEKSINTVAKWLLNIPKPKFLKHFLDALLDKNHNHKLDIEEHSQCNEIIQNCLKDCFMLISAIGAGVIGGEILNITYFKDKKPPLKETNLDNQEPNYNIKANPDEGIDKVSKVLEGDFKIWKAFDKPMAVFDALQITKEKNALTKIKMTAYEIIANALLPTFFISLSMSLTKNLRLAKRIPTVAAAGALGLLLGHRMAVQFNRSVTPELVENLKEITNEISEELTNPTQIP